jgi:hypothetical protein
MRFIITGNRTDSEMIGEQVEIPQAPGQIFAVHPNVFKDMRDWPFAVTHVESGFRLGIGTTIQGAINNALNKALDTGAERLAAAMDFARDLRNSVKVKTS